MRYTKAINPDDVWDSKLRWFLRWRGIALTLVAQLGLGSFLAQQLFDQPLPVFIALLSVVTVTGISLWFCRTLVLRQYNAYIALHNLFHSLREAAALVDQQFRHGDSNSHLLAMKRFNERVVEQTAEYFRRLTGNAGVNCAIRLVEKDPAGSDKKLLFTYARSGGLESSRADRSTPIPVDEGIGKYIRVNHSMGVCFVDDIKEEVNQGNWYSTPNDDKPDVQKLMIAPINSVIMSEQGEPERGFLGILCVTSINLKFSERHACQLMAVADTLGTLYPYLTAPLDEG